MPIGKIGWTTSTSRVQPSVSGQKAVNSNYRFEDRLKFSEKELEKQVSESDSETEEIKKTLIYLIKDVLSNGCSIQSRSILSSEKFNIEASFQPPKNANHIPNIYIPVNGSGFCLEGNNSVFSRTSEAALVKIENIVSNIVNYSNNKTLVKSTLR